MIKPVFIYFEKESDLSLIKGIIPLLERSGIDCEGWLDFCNDCPSFPKEGVTFFIAMSVEYLLGKHPLSPKGFTNNYVSFEEALEKFIKTQEMLTFSYTNYKGKEGFRSVVAPLIYFGCSEYHNEGKPCWLVSAFDLEKKAMRDFLMSDMKAL